MTNLLITGVGAGSTTIHAKRRSTGATADIAATVTSSPVGFDTTTFNATTGAGIGGSTGTPITNIWDVFNATRYPNDVAWRNAIKAPPDSDPRSVLAYGYYPAKVGTGDSTAKYNDGQNPDLTDLDATIQYAGQQTLRCTIHGTGTGATAGSPMIGIDRMPAGIHQIWGWNRRRYETNFTAVGDASDAATFGNASYKITPHINWPTSGRAGLESANGSGQDGDVSLENAPGGTPGASGFVVNRGRMAPMWSDGNWYDVLIFVEQFTGRNGHVWLGLTSWRRKQGDTAYSRWGNRYVQDSGYTGALLDLGEARMLGQNYNQSRATDIYHNNWGIAAFDQATSPDPFGIQAAEAAATPTACTLGSVSGQTSSTATFQLTIGSFARYVRPVVDGVEQTAQEYDLAGETSDGGTLNRTVTGLATGARAISFNVYNANKTAHASTGTQSVTI